MKGTDGLGLAMIGVALIIWAHVWSGTAPRIACIEAGHDPAICINLEHD